MIGVLIFTLLSLRNQEARSMGEGMSTGCLIMLVYPIIFVELIWEAALAFRNGFVGGCLLLSLGALGTFLIMLLITRVESFLKDT